MVAKPKIKLDHHCVSPGHRAQDRVENSLQELSVPAQSKGLINAGNVYPRLTRMMLAPPEKTQCSGLEPGLGEGSSRCVEKS